MHTPITSHLDDFNEAWVCAKLGSLTQIERRRAVNTARKSLQEMSAKNNNELLTHLQAIKFQLCNQPSYEDTLRLQLSAYAIIQYLIQRDSAMIAWLTIVIVRYEKFFEFYAGETVA